MRLLTIGVVLTVVSSCGDLSAPDIAQHQQTIVGGTVEHGHIAVVRTERKEHGGKFGCSATFISSKHLITAAHCLPDCLVTVHPPQTGCIAHLTNSDEYRDGPTDVTVELGLTANDDPGDSVHSLIADHVFFSSNGLDVAILRLQDGDEYHGPVMPLMSAYQIPTEDLIPFLVGDVVKIVGCSNNGHTDDPDTRRSGKSRVIGGYDTAFELDESAYEQYIYFGDSGGAVLFKNAYDVYELGGVHSSSNDYGPLAYPAYIHRGFVDNLLCGDGWELVNADPRNTIAVSDTQVVRVSHDGRVCALKSLSQPPIYKVAIVRSNGDIVTYDEVHGLRLLGNDTEVKQIAATWDAIYKLRKDGTVWRWRTLDWYEWWGGWYKIDDTMGSKLIAASSYHIYKIHSNGNIYWCAPNYSSYKKTCASGWSKIDANSQSYWIEAGNEGLYQAHTSHKIWEYYSGWPNWGLIAQDRPYYLAAVGDYYAYIYDAEYESLYRYSYQTGMSYLAWEPSFRGFVAREGNLYALRQNGEVRKFQDWLNYWDLGGANFDVSGLFGNVASMPTGGYGGGGAPP